MRVVLKLTAAFALSISAQSAYAWNDAYKGDATNNPNSTMLVHTYADSENLCPAGLQPVLAGGMLCCGQPNAGAYVNHAGVSKARKSVVHKKKMSRPRAYAPEGGKGVIYR
jgi:hypothetical protein